MRNIRINKKFTPRCWRRSYDRFPGDGAANLFIDGKLKKPLILKNLSLRGAGVVTDHSLPVSRKVTIVLASSLLTGSCTKKAKIIWCRRLDNTLWEAGIDFGINNLIQFC